jgi:3-oxoacyl-[acyl-carrier-protein] synthase-3
VKFFNSIYTALHAILFCTTFFGRKMGKTRQAVITGLGAYLPEKILSNADLERMVETSNEWIVTRSGIEERRIAADDEFSSTLGAKAAELALRHAHVKASHVDAILVSTMTPDYLCPSTAALIQHQIGASQACALDIQAACSGFIYGLSIAKAWIESGAFKNVLLISTEKNSAFVDYEDRATCVLFGDGAGAVLIQEASHSSFGYALDHICLGTDGEQAELISIPSSGCRHPTSVATVAARQHFLKMNGKEVFKHAVRRMEAAAKECLDCAGVAQEKISWLIPHQANNRIMEAIAKRFEIPWERVFRTIQRYGNTSSSTIPIALTELDTQKIVNHDEYILLTAFGGGLTWGAALLHRIRSE